jgi:hypothetical protein
MIDGNITKASFADESYSGRQWYRTTVLAHVKSTYDFDWILRIESEAGKLGYFGEIKASFAFPTRAAGLPASAVRTMVRSVS